LLSVRTHRRQRLTRPPLGVGDWKPAVSPDGKTLAFVRYRIPGAGDIYLMPLSGGEPRRLTNWNGDIGGLAWMPDSSELIYALAEPAGPRLWRISARAFLSRGTRLAIATGDADTAVISGPGPNHGMRLAYRVLRSQTGARLIDLTQR